MVDSEKPKNNKLKVPEDANEIKQTKPSYDMTNPCTLAIPEGNRLTALRTIFDSVTADTKERLRIVFLQYTKGLKKCREMAENRERRRIATCILVSKIKEIDSKFLDLIDRIVGEYAKAHIPEPITEAAYIMQAAQVCYDEATQKLSALKIKSLKKNLREFNSNLSNVIEFLETLIPKNESLNVYEKEITRSYRGLYERVESNHVVSSNNDTITYDDYFFLFLLDNHLTMFPSLDEFVTVRIDNIHNFFIKKLTNLSKYLCDIVKSSRYEKTLQANWFYCGLTCLIPKEFHREALTTVNDIVRNENRSTCSGKARDACRESNKSVTVQTDAESHSTSHLLFINDLELLEKDSSTFNKSAKMLSVTLSHYIKCKKFIFYNQSTFDIVNHLTIGVLQIEPADFSKLDDAVGAVLITFIEVGITSEDSLQTVETEKLSKYSLLINELSLIYKCNGIVTKHHKSQLKRLEIPMNKAETTSLDRQRGPYSEQMPKKARNVCHTVLLRDVIGVKTTNQKNTIPFFSDGIITSDLEEENGR
ncbi:hypothetical protein CWI38_0179p0030 [Hamiltosporidium tvaerminnensis]|uniref:Uncharacterized protein n=1 Tax=Hamiltosporidium tvaerminnensis TaxID=1176355 RepID=A0A4Q9M115_9MICR|nr:hypothetical protein CWI38_0306p0010 [Hamiltosporidium tvaerminnensis]TBU19892.1 hypothetical protein CWI38_0179p0030 [Hamiltosporidium tvaerminnensis]